MSFHGDESFYITEGITAFRLVREGRLFDPWWSTPLWYTISPPLPKIVIGMSLLLGGVRNGSWEYYTPRGTVEEIPPVSVLTLARIPSAIIAAITLIVVYLIARKIDYLTGLLSIPILGFHSLWLISARRAMSDIYPVMFSSIALFIFILYLSKRNPKMLLLCGVAAGLAVASKYNALPTIVVIAVMLICSCRQQFGGLLDRSAMSKLILRETFLFGGFVLSALAANPYFYTDPVKGLFRVVSYVARDYQFGSLPLARVNPLLASIGIVHSTVWPAWPIPYTFASTKFSWQYLGTYTNIPLAAMFLIGFCKLALETKKGNLYTTTILSWYTIYFIGISFTNLGIHVSRFYVPLVPPICLIAAYGLSRFANDAPCKNMFLALLVFAIFLNFLSFYPELYQSAWTNPTDFPSSFGTFQQSTERPLGFASAILSILVLMAAGALSCRTRSRHLSSGIRRI
jgi:hypothetical protein